MVEGQSGLCPSGKTVRRARLALSNDTRETHIEQWQRLPDNVERLRERDPGGLFEVSSLPLCWLAHGSPS